MEADECTRAYKAALRLLSVRARSEYEIRDRLRKKRFSRDTVDSVIARLIELGSLDYARFTRLWIAERMRKPYGVRRITRELSDKGINPEFIQKEIARATSHYSEAETVATLAQKRGARYRSVKPEIVKRRVFEYLIRRGFTPEAAQRATEKL